MLTEGLIQELEFESGTTRRVLERVPTAQLEWLPHPKSMTLGWLSMHIARTPGFITAWALQDTVEAIDGAPRMEPKSTAEILAAHDEGLMSAKAGLAKLGDEGLQREWRMISKEGAPLFVCRKVDVIRSFALNHLYHHRGQLSVYLRQLDVPVPSIYGPSADENPMKANG